MKQRKRLRTETCTLMQIFLHLRALRRSDTHAHILWLTGVWSSEAECEHPSSYPIAGLQRGARSAGREEKENAPAAASYSIVLHSCLMQPQTSVSLMWPHTVSSHYTKSNSCLPSSLETMILTLCGRSFMRDCAGFYMHHTLFPFCILMKVIHAET